MDRTTSKTVEARIIQKYRQLHKTLLQLVDELQVLEPGGTLMDDIVIQIEQSGPLRIAYSAEPLVVSIADGGKKFIVRVMEMDAE